MSRLRRRPLDTLRGLTLATLLLATAGCAGDEPATAGIDPYLEAYERSQLTIETADGKRHEFDIFLATSPQQRASGLMHVRQLAPDAGMLFFFEVSRRLSFYMKNTILPLDMLFIDSHGRVINIVEHTVPGSLESVESQGRARAVLELNAGTSKKLAITPGAIIRHPFFR